MSDTSAIETTPIIEEIERPITEENPCGEDVTYDDAFQQIKRMIDRSGAVGGRIDQEKALEGGEESIVGKGEAINYEHIVELSREILRDKSKDIRVACYLALGLFYTKGLVGMVEGLTGLHRLVETYWDDLYPAKRRQRARSSSVKFLADRLDDALTNYRPAVDDREALEQSLEVLEPLQTFLLHELEEHAPALSSFKRALRELIRRVPEPVEGNDDADEPADDTAPESAEDTAEPPNDQTTRRKPPRDEEPERTPEKESGYERESDAHAAVLRSAAFLHERDNTSSLPYRLSRTVRWEILRSAPTHVDGKTNIPPPEERRRSHLTDLLAQDRYAALVKKAESIFREPPFHLWLDLQRLLTSGMAALGPSYRDARQTVMTEMGLLLRRVPELRTLTFNDGTPLADTMTREWIELEISTAHDGKQEGPPGDGEPAEGDPLARQFEQARGQLTRGDLSAALKVMNERAEADRSKKDRFRRQLYVASLCMKAGQAAVARPILEQLEQQTHQHGLEKWDPELALDVWTDLYNCYEAMAGTSAVADEQMVRERAARVFERICTLRPDFAVALRSR